MNSISNISNFYSNTNKVKAKDIDENKDLTLNFLEEEVIDKEKLQNNFSLR